LNIKRYGILDIFQGFLQGIAATDASRKSWHSGSIAWLRVIRQQNNAILKELSSFPYTNLPAMMGSVPGSYYGFTV
jgi:hypothetical protein